MKIKCLVVDDEPLAAKVIESYINKIEYLELVAKCPNAVSAFNHLSSSKIDLMFLDIKMPKITGLDLIKSLSDPPKVILTTAYREYAVESYELDVVDYLLKPVSFERFLKAVGKATKQQVDNKTERGKKASEEYIFVKSNKKQIKIYLKDILYIEGLKEYLRIVTTEEKVICYLALAYMVEKLPSDQFIRVHRSYIVNLKNIKSFSSTEVNIAGKTIPIGRHYKQSALSTLENLSPLIG